MNRPYPLCRLQIFMKREHNSIASADKKQECQDQGDRQAQQ